MMKFRGKDGAVPPVVQVQPQGRGADPLLQQPVQRRQTGHLAAAGDHGEHQLSVQIPPNGKAQQAPARPRLINRNRKPPGPFLQRPRQRRKPVSVHPAALHPHHPVGLRAEKAYGGPSSLPAKHQMHFIAAALARPANAGQKLPAKGLQQRLHPPGLLRQLRLIGQLRQRTAAAPVFIGAEAGLLFLHPYPSEKSRPPKNWGTAILFAFICPRSGPQ